MDGWEWRLCKKRMLWSPGVWEMPDMAFGQMRPKLSPLCSCRASQSLEHTPDALPPGPELRVFLRHLTT